LRQKDEGLFVTVMTLCGLRETPERRQLWTKSLRCFDRPIGGKKDLWAIASQLVPHPILRFDGKPYQKIYPCKNPRDVAVLKEIGGWPTFRFLKNGFHEPIPLGIYRFCGCQPGLVFQWGTGEMRRKPALHESSAPHLCKKQRRKGGPPSH